MRRLFEIIAVLGFLLLLNLGCSKKPTKSPEHQEPPPSLTGKIVFVSNRTGAWELYSMNSDGTEVKRLTSNGSEFPEKCSPRISPDGRKVAFCTFSGSICVFDFVGKTTEKVMQASDSLQSFPGISWSPDSKRICFSGGKSDEQTKIWIINTETKALTQLTYGESNWDVCPSWSPKGDLISFWRQDGPYSYDLYVMNTSGSELRIIANDEISGGFPDWSPDASKIAYDCFQAIVLDTIVYDWWLILINSNGTDRVELVPGEFPSFSPTGNQLVFCRQEQSGNYQIYRVDIDGSNVVKLSTMDQYYDWSPDW